MQELCPLVIPDYPLEEHWSWVWSESVDAPCTLVGSGGNRGRGPPSAPTHRGGAPRPRASPSWLTAQVQGSSPHVTRFPQNRGTASTKSTRPTVSTGLSSDVVRCVSTFTFGAF